MTMTPEQKRALIDEVRNEFLPHSGNVWASDLTARLADALEATPDTPDDNEREAQLERAARDLNRFGWTCHSGSHEPGSFDDCEDCRNVCMEVARSAFSAMSGIPHISEIQVWQIAKAEHDYNNDTDNVGAFVEPLLTGLRAAGVPFDDAPFLGDYISRAAVPEATEPEFEYGVSVNGEYPLCAYGPAGAELVRKEYLRVAPNDSVRVMRRVPDVCPGPWLPVPERGEG